VHGVVAGSRRGRVLSNEMRESITKTVKKIIENRTQTQKNYCVTLRTCSNYTPPVSKTPLGVIWYRKNIMIAICSQKTGQCDEVIRW